MTAVRIDASRSRVRAHIDAFVGRVHETAVSQWREFQNQVEQRVKGLEDIAQSPDYTPVGREKALMAARERALDVLKPQRLAVEQIRARLVDVEARALPSRAPRTAADLPALMIEQEIRTRLAGRDPLQVFDLYLAAIARKDDQFCRAIEDAPAAFPMLTPDYLTKGRERKLQACEQAGAIGSLRDELTIHQTILQAAEEDLKTAAAPAVAGPAPQRRS